MPWNTSVSQNQSSEPSPQPTAVSVNIGGTSLQEQSETVTAEWLASKAREKGWSKFICKLNGIEVDDPKDFSVNPGDRIDLMPYDEFGA
ncbi:MAG: hypothetical protein K8S87_07185 [Planctomycetes bacterium]|nr:hypothetical protein [Planctomycetota bacterium]